LISLGCQNPRDRPHPGASAPEGRQSPPRHRVQAPESRELRRDDPTVHSPMPIFICSAVEPGSRRAGERYVAVPLAQLLRGLPEGSHDPGVGVVERFAGCLSSRMDDERCWRAGERGRAMLQVLHSSHGRFSSGPTSAELRRLPGSWSDFSRCCSRISGPTPGPQRSSAPEGRKSPPWHRPDPSYPGQPVGSPAMVVSFTL
jgi:hypothetical protein